MNKLATSIIVLLICAVHSQIVEQSLQPLYSSQPGSPGARPAQQPNANGVAYSRPQPQHGTNPPAFAHGPGQLGEPGAAAGPSQGVAPFAAPGPSQGAAPVASPGAPSVASREAFPGAAPGGQQGTAGNNRWQRLQGQISQAGNSRQGTQPSVNGQGGLLL